MISPCTSDAYILVHQPGIHASDFKSGKCAPHMKRAMVSGREIEKRDTSMQTQRTFEVPYGRHLGDMDREVIEILEWWAKEKCAAEVVGIDASSM